MRPTLRRRRRPGWTGTTEPCGIFGAVGCDRFFTTVDKCLAVAHLVRWHAATNSAIQMSCRWPIGSSRTCYGRFGHLVTTKAMLSGLVRLCPAELHARLVSPVNELDAFNAPSWKSNAATGKATSCAATARASGNGLCVTPKRLKRQLQAPFDACDKQGTRVNSLSLVRYSTNDYSVPDAYGRSGSLDPWLCPRGGYRLRRR